MKAWEPTFTYHDCEGNLQKKWTNFWSNDGGGIPKSVAQQMICTCLIPFMIIFRLGFCSRKSVASFRMDWLIYVLSKYNVAVSPF